MPQHYDLLIFDWDGTLMDSAAAIVAAIQNACRDLGLAVPADRACRSIIGLGLSEALAALLPELPVAEHGRLVDRYRHHYLGQDHAIPLFAGVAQALPDLLVRGHLLAVATGKSRKGLDRALAHTGLAPCFAATRCADECPSKPHPTMVLEILEETGVPPRRALVIGDTSHDMAMARNAGVAGLAVAYGAHDAAELAACAPLAVLESFPELCAWLARCA